MGKNNNLTDFVTDLAGAIRAKCGTTGTINPQDFSKFVGGMPFFKYIRTEDLTSPYTAKSNINLGYIHGYKKAIVYLTNDNGKMELGDPVAKISLNEMGNEIDINTLKTINDKVTISGYPDIVQAVYETYFYDDFAGGTAAISDGWHIKVDIFDLYMGNPDGENKEIDLNNATGRGV